jgi:HEAT repeat protein
MWTIWIGLVLVCVLTIILVAHRLAWAIDLARGHRLESRYHPLIRRALSGDQSARHALVTSPLRRRLFIAKLLIVPLIGDRDAGRIAATRALVRAMLVVPVADRYLRSRWWWRRALALRAFGLLQMSDRTGAIVAALDDDHEDVRGAALDALADLHDPAALPALVVRLHDASLHRGRRAAALAAFGSRCEPLVLELSDIDSEHRVHYAQMLELCGTAASRPALIRWTGDARVEVRAAAFQALAHVGLDDETAFVAIRALESGDVTERAMAARALHDYGGHRDVAMTLAAHLDDAWPVAVQAARSLLSMAAAGLEALQAWAARPDLAGLLARQMLWEAAHS